MRVGVGTWCWWVVDEALSFLDPPTDLEKGAGTVIE